MLEIFFDHFHVYFQIRKDAVNTKCTCDHVDAFHLGRMVGSDANDRQRQRETHE